MAMRHVFWGLHSSLFLLLEQHARCVSHPLLKIDIHGSTQNDTRLLQKVSKLRSHAWHTH